MIYWVKTTFESSREGIEFERVLHIYEDDEEKALRHVKGIVDVDVDVTESDIITPNQVLEVIAAGEVLNITRGARTLLSDPHAFNGTAISKDPDGIIEDGFKHQLNKFFKS